MALTYQTEYRLGVPGRRVFRTYTGLTAVLAIALDLIFFVLILEVLLGLLRLIFRILFWLVGSVATLAYVLIRLPFIVASEVTAVLRAQEQVLDQPGSSHKPVWEGQNDF